MDTSGNLNALVDRVIERAKTEAETIVDHAAKAADREVKRAEEQCQLKLQEVEKTAREIAERQMHSARAEAGQDKMRALMNAREDAVEQVFQAALKALKEIGRPEERLSLLTDLVAEAARAVGTKSVRIHFNEAELAIVKQGDFPAEIAGVAVVVEDETIDAAGGPVVTDDSGRIVFENTFESRLERNREELRRLVADDLHLADSSKEGAS